MISIVTPAFNEAENLTGLYARIVETMTKLGVKWEWIVVDDHSRDGTFAVIQRLSAGDARVRGVRLARNSGSHVAIACGMNLAAGDAVIMMAADLQDPPETIGAMVERWSRGAWRCLRRAASASPRAGDQGLRESRSFASCCVPTRARRAS